MGVITASVDATNVVTPTLAVITPIDFDHEAWLGKSLESIASEKAGIIKEGSTVLLAEQRPEVRHVLLRRAIETGSHCSFTNGWEIGVLSLTPCGSQFTLSTAGRSTAVSCPL